MRTIAAGMLAMAILVVVCGGSNAGDQGESTVPGIEERRFSWRLDVSIPRFADERINQEFLTWLDGVFPPATENLTAFSVLGIDDSRTDVDIAYEVRHQSAAVASVVLFTTVSPFRAAHPSTRVDVLNYELETGRRMSLADLFADPDHAMSIMVDHGKRLVEQELAAATKDKYLKNEDTWFMDGFAPIQENYQAIAIEKNGVRVYFQQYQILPYSYGIVSPLIPLDLLQPAGPNPAVWPPHN